MKIIFFGTPQYAVPSLERFIEHPDIEILAVVTQPDKARGRGKKLIPSAVKKIASAANIPVWQPAKIKKDPETLEKLRNAQADAFVVIAYGQILSQEILDMPTLGCINAHGSILPEYRGAAPIQWCLYDGATTTGVTTMLMDAGMDTGAMLLKDSCEIGWLDNSLDLAIRLSEMSATLLMNTLLGLEAGEITATPQDDAQATYARLIQKSDFALDWTKNAIALHHQICAFFPNCVATFRSENLKISATVPLSPAYESQLQQEFPDLNWQEISQQDGQPGEVIHLLKQEGPVVKTGDGALLLRQVQMAGKRSQSGWDFVNGTRLEVGEMLENG
ncbi:MAG: methionyl-tRNA formyltransferase [Jaaginema sp. PMC 1079.18]|nr:methionyl-tRNA formyltransferase [Jaaginema sp. PMC 1080.18]MEC4850360.1 methionyl-tRNA formyltransferase [Jaaginema sp. PMC 1079.18]MEC4867158.1 methionyl-tRNA formyltransferase [Jaaginema sp. PMC 1078.18]